MSVSILCTEFSWGLWIALKYNIVAGSLNFQDETLTSRPGSTVEFSSAKRSVKMEAYNIMELQ